MICNVTLTVADALGVGLSLSAVAHRGEIPASACESYDRVGRQLIAAAKTAQQQTKRERQGRFL